MILNHRTTIDTPYPTSIATLNGIKLENVEVFRYLGSDIRYNQPSTGQAELHHRIDAAKIKFKQLDKLLLNYKIKLSTRVIFLNSYVRSRMTYACQQWNLTKSQMEKMNIEYRQMLRKLVRGGHRKHESSDEDDNRFKFKLLNSDIHRLCHTEDIEHFIKRQQKKYLAHIIRESDNNSSKKQLLFNDDKYCKVGRHTPSLLEQVLETESTFTRDQLFKAAMNRKL